AAAPSPSTGFITLKLAYDPSGGMAATSVLSMIRAATGGRPEFYPAPDIFSTAAGGPGTVTYNLRSPIGTPQLFHLPPTAPYNPDSFNALNKFPYTPPPTPVTLPGAGTLQISIPVFLPGNIYPGNLNAYNISAQSQTDLTKLSDAKGFAIASSPDPDSLPSSLWPSGLVKIELGHAASGRDGPTPIPDRGLW